MEKPIFENMLWKLAHKYKMPPIIRAEDLVSVGNIAIIKAKKNFLTGRGTKLSTYIYRAIKNSMLTFVTANSGATGMAFSTYKRLSKEDSWSNSYVRTTEFEIFDKRIEDSSLNKCILSEKISLVRQAVEALEHKKRFIAINSEHFLGVLTIGELAKELNLSKQRIYQLEKETKKALSYRIPRSVV